jgi:signal transduction protein with GAF and PtsI domain
LEDSGYDWHKGQKIGRYRTLLGVPLLREGMPLGAFVLMRKTVRPFTDEQINLVARFADQAVIAIENARLFESEQQRTRELTEALQQQTATADVFKVISRSTFDLQSILEALTESATRLCGATRGTTRRWLRRLTREVRASTRKLRQVWGHKALTKQQLEGAPTYRRDETPAWGDRAYEQSIHDYYKSPPYWA